MTDHPAWTTEQAYQQQNPMTYSAPAHQPYQHPQTPPAPRQEPLFQGNFALFPNTRNPQAKHQYSGRVSLNVADLPRIMQALQAAVPDVRGQVSLSLIGFDNVAKQTGQQYIGGYVLPGLSPSQPQQQPPQAFQQAPPMIAQGQGAQATAVPYQAPQQAPGTIPPPF